MDLDVTHPSQATLSQSQNPASSDLDPSQDCWCKLPSTSIFSSLPIRAALLLLGLRGSAHGSLQSAPTLLDQRVIRDCKAGKRNLFFLRPNRLLTGYILTSCSPTIIPKGAQPTQWGGMVYMKWSYRFYPNTSQLQSSMMSFIKHFWKC